MKVSKKQLKKIIQEELSSIMNEEELEEGWLDDLIGWFKKPAPNASQGVATNFLRSPYTPYEKEATSSLVPQIDDEDEEQEKERQAGSITPVDDEQIVSDEPISQDIKPQNNKTDLVKFLQPIEDKPLTKKVELPYSAAVEDEPQQNLFTYAAGVKKDEELKQKWQKEYDDAKSLPFSKALDAIKAISNNPQAHKDIRKKAKSYIDRVLNNESKKNNSYNKLYENWQKYIKAKI